jgi:hypothetical protein
VLEQAWAINAGREVGRTPSTNTCMAKEGTQSLGTGGHRNPAPTALSVARQKRIHILQVNIVERTIPLAQPTQELPYMPTLAADGNRRQAALAVLVGGKVG